MTATASVGRVIPKDNGLGRCLHNTFGAGKGPFTYWEHARPVHVGMDQRGRTKRHNERRIQWRQSHA